MKPANWAQTTDLGQWFIDIGRSSDSSRSGGIRSVIMLTAWELWKERNSRIFNKTVRTPEQVFHSIQEEAKVWVRAGNKAMEVVLSTSVLLGLAG
jgi:hypothetical protein